MGELKKTERRRDGGIGHVRRLHRYLVVRLYQIDLDPGEDRCSIQGDQEGMGVVNWVTIRDGHSVESPQERQSPRYLVGTMCRGDAQLLDEGLVIPNSCICSKSLCVILSRSKSLCVILSRSGAKCRVRPAIRGPAL